MLSVAYPFAPVSRDTAGGAEQVLAMIDAGLTGAGHTSLVMAQTGSRVAGTLLPMPRPHGPLDDAARARFERLYRDALAAALRSRRIDLVHMHGVDYQAYLPEAGLPVLATLHLPPGWYPPAALAPLRPRTFVHGVSAAQHRAAARPGLLSPIENGIELEAFAGRHAKRRFVLMLARMCPEKGVHLAIDAAKQAELPLLIAGKLFPYPDHERYFADAVAPRLDRWRRYIGPVGLARKRRLLGAAHCVVIASTVAETSSLVAREALAAGTAVVALARGALVDAVDHGVTGFLANDVAELAFGLRRAHTLDGRVCRQVARARFDGRQMVASYIARYRELIADGLPETGAAA
ncbi:glycosyltransferase [Chelatococcus reniformis]|uniref:glycosyltransferase n=1 Tax=Chelatococcus reniformis TaxID=1494448 RepID=UPI001FCF1D37|nr:glycosyltransferase [Chelatococcus reniformis]